MVNEVEVFSDPVSMEKSVKVLINKKNLKQESSGLYIISSVMMKTNNCLTYVIFMLTEGGK